MKVVFWGIRGSGAAVGKEYEEYGGNTSCVSAEWGNHLIIFDAGTGISKLGESLVRRGFTGEIHLFLSHFHLDHICGLPLFGPAFSSKVRIHIYGNTTDPGGLKGCVSRVLSPPYWPVAPDCYGARMVWHDLKPGKQGQAEVMEDKDGTAAWMVKALPSAHPNGGLIYRLEAAGRSVVYGLDCELPEEFWEIYRDFACGADLLIFDAAYSEEEYPKVKGFGHATWQQGAAMARHTGAVRTVFAHHRRERTDKELEALNQIVLGQEPKMCFGKEGMEILLQEA